MTQYTAKTQVLDPRIRKDDGEKNLFSKCGRYIFPIEFQLLLLCSSYFSEKETFCAFKDNHKIDWTVFLSLLHRHRVLPMVCHNLHRWGIELPIKNELKQESIKHAKNALQQTALLLEINKLFRDNGIECVHFKGPSLSYYLYQDPSLRQYRDIDILIGRKNIHSACNLLIENKFQNRSPVFKKNHLNRHYQKIRKDYIFKKHHHEIELHWLLLDILDAASNQTFLSHTVSISWGNQTVTVFDDHYYLSYLILHGYYSGWARLHWLVDILDFIKKHIIDFEKIKIILNATNHESALDEALELLHRLFLIDKPILTDIPEKNIRNAIGLMQLPIKNSFLSKYDIIIRYRENFLLQKGWANKLKHFKKILATSPEDWQILPLPKPLFFLYYPLRPFLWFIRRVKQ